MELNNTDLRLWVEESRPLLQGSVLSKVQQLSPNAFKFKFSTREGQKDLVFLNGKALWLTQLAIPAPEQPSNFSLFLRKRLKGARVSGLELHGFDRVIVLELSSKTSRFFLVFELFGSGNLVLCDNELLVLTALEQRAWKDREIRRRFKYDFPVSGGKQQWFEQSLASKSAGSVNSSIDLSFRGALEKEVFTESRAAKRQKELEYRLGQQQDALKRFEEKSAKFKELGDKIYENHSLLEGILGGLLEARKKHSWAEIRSRLAGAENSGQARRVKDLKPKQGKVIVEL